MKNPKRQACRALRAASFDGFTLIELLIVIAIIAVLAVIGFGVSRRAIASARSSTCVSNLKQMGMAHLMYANDHNGKLIPLQPSENPDTGKRPPIWPVQLAQAGYLWDGTGKLPCGEGVWTCPDCDFMSNAYGGYGLVEDSIFVYEENTPFGVSESGSLRLNKIADPANTWLIGDVTRNANEPNKGWYALWSQPGRWDSHGPAARHNGKVNVCMVDGHVESLTIEEIERRGLTENVVE